MINYFKIALYSITFIGLISLSSYLYYLINDNKRLNNLNRQLDNNTEFYQNYINGQLEKNNTLELNIKMLENTNDKQLNSIKQLMSKNNILAKELKTAYSNTTIIRDTIIDTIQFTDSCSFDKTIEFNELTKVYISNKDTIFKCILDITNQQDLLVYSKKEYVNDYKNSWCRFWNFDWKKKLVNKYVIENSNNLIKTTDVRVVTMEDTK